MRTFFAFGCAVATEFRANKRKQTIAGHIFAKNLRPPIPFDESSRTLIRPFFIGPFYTYLHLPEKVISRCRPRPLQASPQGVLCAKCVSAQPESSLARYPS